MREYQAQYINPTSIKFCLKNEKTVKLLQETNSLGFTYGDHPYFKTKFGIVTLDLLSSILEIEGLFNTIDQFSPQKVLEIGAGSGRTANALLEFNPLLKYVIADIPPASFIAMSRLKHAYPDKKIYFACDQVELEQYLIDPNSWDILFLLPTLLTNFPLKYFDITLAIDCLHEMNTNMRHFFAEIATAKSKLYYFKIWKSTTIPLDNLFLTSSDLIDFCFEYNMIKLFSRECKFPSNYSEFLFKTS